MTEPAKEALKHLAPWAKASGYVLVIFGAVALLKTPACMAVTALVAPDAHAQAVEVVAPVKEDVARLKDADAKLSERLATVERSATRTEVMVEMLLRDREIRPPPKVLADAGTP